MRRLLVIVSALAGIATATPAAARDIWKNDQDAANHTLIGLPAPAGVGTAAVRLQDVAVGACIPKWSGINGTSSCAIANTDYLTAVFLAPGALGFGSGGGVLTGDASNAHWDSTNFRAGFRTSAPAYQLHLVDQAAASDRGIAIGTHGASDSGAAFNFLRSKGTFATPTIVANTNYGATTTWKFYDGTTYLDNVQMGTHVTPGTTAAAGNVLADWYLRASNTGAQDPYAGSGLLQQLNVGPTYVQIGYNPITPGILGTANNTALNVYGLATITRGAVGPLTVINNTKFSVSNDSGLNNARISIYNDGSFGANSAAGLELFNDLNTAAHRAAIYYYSSTNASVGNNALQFISSDGDMFFNFGGSGTLTTRLHSDGKLALYNSTAAVSVSGSSALRSNAGVLQYSENGGAWKGFSTGSVTNVTATLPLTSSGGATPNIALQFDNASLTLNVGNGLQRAALAGDLNCAAGSNTCALTNIPSGTTMAGSLLATAIAAPGTPASGKGSIYVDSTSKNISVKDDAGVVKHGVRTKAAVASNFLTAIADDGTVTAAQPAYSDITGTPADLSGMHFVTDRAEASLSAEVSLGALTNGTLQQTVSGAVATISAFNGTTGSVPFYTSNGQLAQDNSKLFWDNTNKRLGIGTASPSFPVEITDTASGAATLRLDNTTGGGFIYISKGATGIGGIGSSGTWLGSGATDVAFGAYAGKKMQFFTNNSTASSMDIATTGTVTLSSLGSGLVKATSGALAIASSTDVATALTMPIAERIPFSAGPTSPLNSDAGWTYDISADTITISGGDSFALYNVGTRNTDVNYERLRLFRASNLFNFKAERLGTGVTRGIQFTTSAGVDIDDMLSVNGPTPLTNSAFQVGHTTNTARDHVQIYLGGGGSQDTPSNTMFDIFMAGTTIGTGSNGGAQVTARVRGFTLTGSGSPTPSEVTGLFVDAPTLSGITAPVYSIHTGIGAVAIDNLNGGGYVGAELSTGKLQTVKATSEFSYFMEITTGTITTLNAADQYIATSDKDAMFGSTQVEYPTAQTVPTYVRLEACIIGANTISSGAVDVASTINGVQGAQLFFSSASSGCQRTAATLTGTATDLIGAQLWQHQTLGVRQTATLSGTLRMSIRVRVSPYSTF